MDTVAAMEDVRMIKIFDKNIPIRKYGCKNFSNKEPSYIKNPRINLFIQVTNNCNANCNFCIYKNNEKRNFNLNKLALILKELSSINNLDIGKLNYTGGEPCLDLNLLDDIISCTKENLKIKNQTEITLNTNGIYLNQLLKYENFFDSIGLSHHHYNDDLNIKIFNSKKIALDENIRTFMSELKNKKILQLRCNLIKGYIDSYDEILKYMDKSIDLGVHDCGFVTLAPNNDFCKNHQIDFKSLVNINKDLIKVNQWNRVDDNDFDKNYCECANYIYSNKYGEMCKFYSRLFCRNDLQEGMLVYDGSNLRYGFYGTILI